MTDRALCGWRVRSDLALPELPPWCGDERSPDVTIRLAALPEAPATVEVDADGGVRFEPAGVAAFLVRDGREVLVAPRLPPGAEEIRCFLFGTVFGALCHQRRLLPLHACCAVVGGRAVAVAGPSGAGKSTLAAELARRGHALLADDVAVVDWRRPGGPVVLPGIKRLKLWADALDRLGLAADPAARVRPGMDKFSLPATLAEGPVPLAALCHLVVAPEASAALQPVRGVEAVSQLVLAVYRDRLGRRIVGEAGLVEAAAAVAAAVPSYRLERGADVAGLPRLADLVDGAGR